MFYYFSYVKYVQNKEKNGSKFELSKYAAFVLKFENGFFFVTSTICVLSPHIYHGGYG